MEVVNQSLRDNFIRPDESEKAKAELKRNGQHRLIDKVDVRLVASEDKFWATCRTSGTSSSTSPKTSSTSTTGFLGVARGASSTWSTTCPTTRRRSAPFTFERSSPSRSLLLIWRSTSPVARDFNRDEWLDLVMRSIGLESDHFDVRGKLLAVLRLVPMVERNYNLIELGPWGTGKSFVYRETSPNAMLVSGGKVTVAQLFVNLSSGRIGLLGMWDVVAFDEVAGLEMSDSTVINMLKDYMESGSFARGKEETPAEASLVFVGNTSKAHQDLVRTAHLFADLPKAMIDPAFLDRLHYYLPGWEVPKLDQRLFTSHFGLVSDYLAEALRQLRKQSFVRAIDEDFALGADLLGP